MRGREILTSLGADVLGYRSPSWDFSPVTLDLLVGARVPYSSNLMDDIRPYRHPGARPRRAAGALDAWTTHRTSGSTARRGARRSAPVRRYARSGRRSTPAWPPSAGCSCSPCTRRSSAAPGASRCSKPSSTWVREQAGATFSTARAVADSRRMTDVRVAIVTGGARGLGEGIAARLLEEGWRLGVVDLAGSADAATRLDPSGGPHRRHRRRRDGRERLRVARWTPRWRRSAGSTPWSTTPGSAGRRPTCTRPSPTSSARARGQPCRAPSSWHGPPFPELRRRGERCDRQRDLRARSARRGRAPAPTRPRRAVSGLSGSAWRSSLPPTGSASTRWRPGNMLTAMHADHVQSVADRYGHLLRRGAGRGPRQRSRWVATARPPMSATSSHGSVPR